MIPRIAAVIFALSCATPALADTPPPISAGHLDLARRLVGDIGGAENQVTLGSRIVLNMGKLISAPALYRKAYLQAMDDHRADMAEADLRWADIFARNFSDDELSNFVAFQESPQGRAIAQKTFAANRTLLAGAYAPPVLGADEKAARDKFFASPQGKAANQKFMATAFQTMTLMAGLLQPIQAEAMTRYCKAGGDCSKIAVAPVHAPANPAPRGDGIPPGQ